MRFSIAFLLLVFTLSVCADDVEELQEFEASLAKVDDSKVMSNYGNEGSAISLQLGGVALQISNKNLVSKVETISGATSITGDPSGFGFTVGLSGDYLFEFDKDTLTDNAEDALDSVLSLYRDYDGTEIKIDGHTDSKGSNDYNLDLSKRRAETVKSWFMSNDIPERMITTKGYGESDPVAPNNENGQDFPEGRALNRRVEITIKTNKKVNHLPIKSS